MLEKFKLTAPASISFSGGRSSGMMLAKCLEAHDGKLPDGVHVLFCNTGAENPATLDFVHECETHWGVNIVWLELDYLHEKPESVTTMPRIVNYETASRNCEPFEGMLRSKAGYLPNATQRFCTEHLKINPMFKYMHRELGFTGKPLTAVSGEYTECIGIRADEPRRVAKIKAAINDGSHQNGGRDIIMPLAEAGISAGAVSSFWHCQPFALNLPMLSDGSTLLGNCEMCFLKGRDKKLHAIKAMLSGDDETQKRLQWWVNMEKNTQTAGYKKRKGKFHNSYTIQQLIDLVQRQDDLPMLDDSDDDIQCIGCTD